MALRRSAPAGLLAPAGGQRLHRRLLAGLVLLAHGALLLALWLAHGVAHPGAGKPWPQHAVLRVQLLPSADPPAGEPSQPRPLPAPPPAVPPRMPALPLPAPLSMLASASAAPVHASPVPQLPAWPVNSPGRPQEVSPSGRGDAAAAPGVPAVLQQTSPPAPASSPPEQPTAALRMARADHRHCPPASYPALLRDRGIEGAVLLRVRVDASGQPADVQLLSGSGFRLFDEAALRQVRGCRFIPAARGDEFVESWVEFPVRFALQAG